MLYRFVFSFFAATRLVSQTQSGIAFNIVSNQPHPLTESQRGHLDFHTAPELRRSVQSVFSFYRSANPFPGGKFGLPEPAEGCPQGENFLSGSLDHSFPYAYATSPFRLKGQARGGHVVQWFCMKDEAENDFPWPSGAYCIYQSGGHCPKGEDVSAESRL